MIPEQRLVEDLRLEREERGEDGDLGDASQLRGAEACLRADPVGGNLQHVLAARDKPGDEDGLEHAPLMSAEVEIPRGHHHSARKEEQEAREACSRPVDHDHVKFG